MEKIELKATGRNIKDSVKRLRKSGSMPAVLYGHNVTNQALSIKTAEFDKAFKKAGESTIITLITDDSKQHPVLIHDVQGDILTGRALHADFYEVSMTEKLTATVALEFTGEADAVKVLGGTLVKNLSEVEVECLPADLPHNITVDVSVLKTFSDAILVKDLAVSGKVTVLTPHDETVAKVQQPRDVEAELAAPVVEDVSAVEGAAETKPEGEAGEAPAEGEKQKE